MPRLADCWGHPPQTIPGTCWGANPLWIIVCCIVRSALRHSDHRDRQRWVEWGVAAEANVQFALDRRNLPGRISGCTGTMAARLSICNCAVDWPALTVMNTAHGPTFPAEGTMEAVPSWAVTACDSRRSEKDGRPVSGNQRQRGRESDIDSHHRVRGARAVGHTHHQRLKRLAGEHNLRRSAHGLQRPQRSGRCIQDEGLCCRVNCWERRRRLPAHWRLDS
jgi:hypothetical protein